MILNKANSLKSILTLSLIYLFLASSPAQDIGTAHYTMNANDMSIRFSNSGDLFKDGHYRFDDSEGSLAKSWGLWLGGFDLGVNPKIATAGSLDSFFSDFSPGPLRDDGQTDEESKNNWDKIFSVRKEDIVNHKNAYQVANQTGSDLNCDLIPDDVKYWPARGNPFFSEKYGFDLPDQFIARFYDANGDRIYNPCDGDYPTIDGRSPYEILPKEIAFFITNDYGYLRTGVRVLNIQMEVHNYIYQYDTLCLDQSTFVKHILINKSESSIVDLHFGNFIDFDIGCPEDDYIGVHPNQKSLYFYNSSEQDCNNSVQEESLPSINIHQIEFPLSPKKFKRDDQGEIIYQDGEPVLIDPEIDDIDADVLVEEKISRLLPIYDMEAIGTETEKHRLLDGLFSDGTPMTVGGIGRDNLSLDTTTLAFTGNPSDPNAWSMCTIDDFEWDAKCLVSTNPLRLQPNAFNEATFVIDYTTDFELPCPNLLDRITERQQFLERWSRDPQHNKCPIGTSTNQESEESISIYPNPTNDIVFIDADIEDWDYQVIDMNGRVMSIGVMKGSTIDLTQLTTGLYVLSLSNGDRVVTEKLMKF